MDSENVHPLRFDFQTKQWVPAFCGAAMTSFVFAVSLYLIVGNDGQRTLRDIVFLIALLSGFISTICSFVLGVWTGVRMTKL